MKKIWTKICDWIVEKFGGVTFSTFEYWMRAKNNSIKELQNEIKYIKDDYDNARKANVKLLKENAHIFNRLANATEYIDKINKPRKEFVNIGYLSTYPEVYTDDNIEYIVTTGLLEKIRNSNVIKYDYRDGEVVASIEVIK